jgi:hypothetical protein
MIRFKVFQSAWFRGHFYDELRRQNYDLRTTFPPTHPTQWLAMLYSGNQESTAANLRFNTSDTESSAYENFIYDLDTELSQDELRGLWSIFTNESEHLQFIQLINDQLSQMSARNGSANAYEHYYALHKYLVPNPLEKSLQNPDVANYMDVTDYILSINLQ